MQMIITGKVHSDITEHNPKWVTVRSLCLLCYFREVYFNQIDLILFIRCCTTKAGYLGNEKLMIAIVV